MATIEQHAGIPFRGKLGGYVGYVWKQRYCIRTYRKEIRYPNTAAQQQQRSWFISMVKFASCATDALRLGMKQRADEMQMTEGNYFVKQNKHCFKRNANIVDIDYRSLVLSEGGATDVYFHRPRFEQNEIVEIGFDKNITFGRASGEDRVYAYFYSPTRGEGYLAKPSSRRNKSIKVCLPEHWADCEVHIYGFVIDHNGRASRSTYIGSGRVDHAEDRGLYAPADSNWQEFVSLAKNTQNSEIGNEESPSHYNSVDADDNSRWEAPR